MASLNIDKLFTNEQIQKRIVSLGDQITEDYKNEDNIIVICLLKGGFIFTADLVRYIKNNVRIEFMVVSSYGDSETSSGVVTIKQDITCDVQGKNIIIVDDIIDTGNTLYEIKDIIKGRFPKSLKTCCLLDKKERRVRDVSIDYTGFYCPDKYVIGYGMDSANHYRNLPYIGVVNQS